MPGMSSNVWIPTLPLYPLDLKEGAWADAETVKAASSAMAAILWINLIINYLELEYHTEEWIRKQAVFGRTVIAIENVAT